MTQSLHPSAAKGFGSGAELYQQVRPSYPQEIAIWLQDRLQIGESSTVVECVQAFSDQLPLQNESVDAMVCAQSFHWFSNIETLTEIHRVLKPSGHLGLVWNQRDIQVDWVRALADEIAPFEADTPRYHSEKWKQVFENQELFRFIGLDTFQLLHRGTVEQVVSKRLLSTSFIAAMSAEHQQQLKARFEQIVFDFTGLTAQDQIDFPYTTFAYHFQKTSNSL